MGNAMGSNARTHAQPSIQRADALNVVDGPSAMAGRGLSLVPLALGPNTFLFRRQIGFGNRFRRPPAHPDSRRAARTHTPIPQLGRFSAMSNKMYHTSPPRSNAADTPPTRANAYTHQPRQRHMPRPPFIEHGEPGNSGDCCRWCGQLVCECDLRRAQNSKWPHYGAPVAAPTARPTRTTTATVQPTGPDPRLYGVARAQRMAANEARNFAIFSTYRGSHSGRPRGAGPTLTELGRAHGLSRARVWQIVIRLLNAHRAMCARADHATALRFAYDAVDLMSARECAGAGS